MEIKVASIQYQCERQTIVPPKHFHELLQEYLSEHSLSRFATLREDSLDEMKSGEMVCGLLETGVSSEDCLVESLLTWDILHTIKLAGEPERVDSLKLKVEEILEPNLSKYTPWEEKSYEADYDWYKSRFVSDLKRELSKVAAV